MEEQLQQTLAGHRAYLVRWMTALTNDAQTAEDLAQETLTEAWCNRHKLFESDGLKSWLNAIAVNVYKRWQREQGKDAARYVAFDEAAATPELVEVELERDELVSLLDNALALLTPDLQALLTARYLEGVSSNRLAETLGVSENALAVRLHRGKLKLRELLTSATAEAAAGEWKPTRIWCVTCGSSYYEGKLDSQTGELHIRCPRCTPRDLTAWSHVDMPSMPIVAGLRSLKPALYRLMRRHDQRFPPALAAGEITCECCGARMSLQLEFPADVPKYTPDSPGVHYRCPSCGHLEYTALTGIAISTPEGRRFLRAYPRVRQRAIERFERDGRDVLALSWESLPSPDRAFTVMFAQDSYAVLAVVGQGDRD